MTKLFRAVPVAGFDGAKRYYRQSTPRTPMNIPYVVDNLWELLRPAHMPSRRHAVYASPTPELALANASSATANRADYLVCELAFVGEVRMAQLAVADARYHSDVRTVQQAALGALGADFGAQSLAERALVAPLYLPGLSAGHMRELVGRSSAVQTTVDQIRQLSNFWQSASPCAQAGCDGELFLELIDGASYELYPV